MIFSSINSKDDFTSYPKAGQRAFKYIKENYFVNMEPGVFELVHEKYLDVQFLVSVREKLGFTIDTGNY